MLLAALLLGIGAVAPACADDRFVPDPGTPSPGSGLRPAFDDPSPGTADYTLGTGDKVRVTVYDEDDLSGTFQIDAKGYVQLPLVGQIPAAGHTAHDLADKLSVALADGYLRNPRVNIEVAQYRPIYVVGEVAKPGEYEYANGMTVPSAVALAGGYTIKAVNSWAYVRHAHENAEHRVGTTEASKIEPGDVVRVTSTAFWDVIDVISPISGISGAAAAARGY